MSTLLTGIIFETLSIRKRVLINLLSAYSEGTHITKSLTWWFRDNLFLCIREEDSFLLINNYIEAHVEIQKKLPSYVDLITFSSQVVVQESVQNVMRAIEDIEGLNLDNKSIDKFRTRQFIRATLRVQEQLIEDLEAEGILNEKGAAKFYKKIRRDFRKVGVVDFIEDAGLLLSLGGAEEDLTMSFHGNQSTNADLFAV